MKSINPIQTFTASCIHRGKKVLQHFITLLNDEKVLILRAKHNLLIDWYTRSRLEKNLSITLVLTVWMCNLFKEYTVISTTSSLCKKSGNYFVSKGLILTSAIPKLFVRKNPQKWDVYDYNSDFLSTLWSLSFQFFLTMELKILQLRF